MKIIDLINKLMKVRMENGNIDIRIMDLTDIDFPTADIIEKDTIFIDNEGNEKIAYLYDHFHPGIIRLINMIIKGAKNKNVEVHICGEMASDPLATMLLIGLGISHLSMGPAAIPEIKKIIRSVTYQECVKLVDTVLTMKTAVDINKYLFKLMSTKFPYVMEKRI